MKKIPLLLFTALMVSLLSCSKDGGSETENTPPADNQNNNPDQTEPEPLSYATDIRPIFNANCTSCHGDPPTQNAPMSLTTLALIQDAIENRGLLGRINNTGNPMPPTGLMPLSSRQRIEAWADQGYPE